LCLDKVKYEYYHILFIKNGMKISKKIINGKEYIYAIDSIYVAKGHTILKNKSLGRADKVKDISIKKKDFYEDILNEETKSRTSYWTKFASTKFKKYVFVEKIELLRSKLFRGKESVGEIAKTAMNTAFMVDFIFNSNTIEGSKVPRERVEEIVKERNFANDEVNNTIKAIYFVENKFKFNKASIKKLHDILLKHEPSNLGFRKEKVVVGNMDVLDWQVISKELDNLLVWYKEASQNTYPPELAFLFYYKFERIHPFKDGNGRTGRLIMNRILKEHRYHPIIIWNKRRKAHLGAFRTYLEGKDENYLKFMSDQLEKTYEIYLEKIEKAFNLDAQMKYFLEPSEYNY